MNTAGDKAHLLVLRARYVFPVAGPPIRDGFVAIGGERIVAVGPMVRASRRRRTRWMTWAM